jgi:hypothetical protein
MNSKCVHIGETNPINQWQFWYKKLNQAQTTNQFDKPEQP